MCDDPMHDPTPVLDAVGAHPGLSTDDLHTLLYREYGVTNQPARVGIAVSEKLVVRKRRGPTTKHYLRGHE